MKKLLLGTFDACKELKISVMLENLADTLDQFII